MAGSKVNIKKLEAALAAAIKEVESPQTMKEVGEEMADRIRKRTRLGKGVAERGGNPEPLKPLSRSYRDQRAGKVAFFTDEEGIVHPYKPKRAPKLSPQTSAGKSNLTRTGELLDSIAVLTAKLGSVIIGLKGKRNKDVAAYVSQDRPFLNLSKPELNGLARLIRERIDKVLKRKA